MNTKEWERKIHQREHEIMDEMYADPPPSKERMDILILEEIELSIRPYSRWWRWGYKAVLRRARKALEEKYHENH